MKEITRIHIARVPYDIEIIAKKHLEAYLKTLDAYGMDSEIIEDIEIRITEILADRGVKKGDVVSDDDVSALTEQLGDPSDFADDAVMPKEDSKETNTEASRKLFRDTDGAILGGVLSGLATFLSLNVVWVRLIFILASLVSFGTAFLVYVVLWIVVPPAKTATDKLRMVGQPVTIVSIREYNTQENVRRIKEAAVSGRRVVVLFMGIGSVLGAILAMLLTIGVGVRTLVYGYRMFADSNSHLLDAAFLLFIMSGLLLTVFFILVAFASFAQKITRKTFISICIVVALGLATFGTAVGLTQYNSLRHGTLVQGYFKAEE